MTWIGPDREAQVEVPDLLGLTVAYAQRVVAGVGLKLVTKDPDGPPLSALTWRRSCLVVAQRPVPGSLMRRLGSLEVDYHEWPPGEEESGDREPRRPLPHLDAPGAERDPADERRHTGADEPN